LMADEINCGCTDGACAVPQCGRPLGHTCSRCCSCGGCCALAAAAAANPCLALHSEGSSCIRTRNSSLPPPPPLLPPLLLPHPVTLLLPCASCHKQSRRCTRNEPGPLPPASSCARSAAILCVVQREEGCALPRRLITPRATPRSSLTPTHLVTPAWLKAKGGTPPPPLTHPNPASACAVASRGSWGATATKAAISAVTEHPAAVTSVSMGTPLLTTTTRRPSVICGRGGEKGGVGGESFALRRGK